MEEEIKTQVEKIKDLSDEINGSELQPEAGEKETAGESVKVENIKTSKPFTQWPVFGWFLNSKSAGAVVGKSVLLLVIPYACLFILSAIFGNSSVKEYGNSPIIILCVSGALLVANIILIVWAIIRFRKNTKG